MRKLELLHNLPWLPLGPTEEVLRKIEYHISSDRGDFYSVFGPSGCGKTRFMMELTARLEQSEHIVARNITACEKGFYRQISDILGCSENEEEIIARLEEVPPTGLKMVLLVDGADCLSNEELAFLYRTKERINRINRHPDLVLVLFMDLNNQDIFSKEILRHSNSYTLGPVNLMQVRDLLTHVYQYYGKTHDYSMAKLRELHAFSYGYPGRVVRLIAPDFEPYFKIKRRHIITIFALILLIIVTIFGIHNREELLEVFGFEDLLPPPITMAETGHSALTPYYEEIALNALKSAENRDDNRYSGIIIIQSESVSDPDISSENSSKDSLEGK